MNVFLFEGSLGTGHPLTVEPSRSLEKPKGLGVHQKGTILKIKIDCYLFASTAMFFTCFLCFCVCYHAPYNNLT